MDENTALPSHRISSVSICWGYVECDECGMIIFNEHGPSSEAATPCEYCGGTEPRRIWMHSIPAMWIEEVYNLPTETGLQRNFLSVMITSAVESILRQINADILRRQGASLSHIQILLNSHRQIRNAKKLYKALTGTSADEVWDKYGLGTFKKAFNNLVESRNQYVHGGMPGEFAKACPSVEDLEAARNHLIAAYYYLNNYSIKRDFEPPTSKS